MATRIRNGTVVALNARIVVERSKVSNQTMRALERLAKNVRKNTPLIERKLKKAGVKPDPALVFSAAMYYRALNKLAKT